MKTLSRILTISLLAFPIFVLKAVPLFADGRPQVQIVVAPDAVEPVRLAATELAHWLERITGVPWPIAAAPDQIAADTIPLFIGDSKWARAYGFNPATVGPDGFHWLFTPEYLIIAGRDYPGGALPGQIHPQRLQEVWNPELRLGAFGEMGTWNGVCRFLEKFAGIRWYMTGELGTVAPHAVTLDVPELDQTIAPDFEYRYAWFCDFPEAPEDALWYRRAGFGAPAPVTITHNFANMLRYQESHPEYFALIGGKRDFSNLSTVGGGNLCLSNPAVVQQWIDDISAYFAAHPDQTLHPLCPMDGMFKICECAACQAQLSPELGSSGRYSNYVWRFSDRVARGVAERCPGKMVGTFAYESYLQPPSDPATLAPNLAVMICYTRQELRAPTRKKEIRDLIGRWNERTESLYFWTYPIFDYWLPWRGFPSLYPTLLAEDIRANRELGARGEFLESEFRMPNDQQVSYQHIAYPGLSHLTAYLTIKLLWDADADVNALLDEYYINFYGAAADPMRRFWQSAETLFLAQPGSHPIKQYNAGQIQHWFALLDEAMAAVVPDSVEARRIALIRDEMTPFAKRLLRLVDSNRTMRVPRAAEGFQLNADLQQSPWRNARRYKLAAKDGTPAEFTTYVLTLADAEGIGFTFINFEPEMAKLVMKTTERDTGAVWDDDSVEIFLCHADGSQGRLFIVTAAGNLYDAAWQLPGDPNNTGWNTSAQWLNRRLNDRWIMQIKIPWSELGVTAENTGDLRVNLYRNRVVGAPIRYASFAPTMTHQHQVPEFFSPLELE